MGPIIAGHAETLHGEPCMRSDSVRAGGFACQVSGVGEGVYMEVSMRAGGHLPMSPRLANSARPVSNLSSQRNVTVRTARPRTLYRPIALCMFAADGGYTGKASLFRTGNVADDRLLVFGEELSDKIGSLFANTAE